MEVHELKWNIKIYPKPQGRWRPLIEVKWWNTGTSNTLGIKREWTNLLLYPSDKPGCIHICCDSHKEYIYRKTRLKMYTSSEVDCLNESCPKMLCHEMYLQSIREKTFKFYPEYRTGIPDYTDYIEMVKNIFLLPAVAEYERRIKEAMESLPTTEIVVTSDDSSIKKDIITPVRSLVLEDE